MKSNAKSNFFLKKNKIEYHPRHPVFFFLFLFFINIILVQTISQQADSPQLRFLCFFLLCVCLARLDISCFWYGSWGKQKKKNE